MSRRRALGAILASRDVATLPLSGILLQTVTTALWCGRESQRLRESPPLAVGQATLRWQPVSQIPAVAIGPCCCCWSLPNPPLSRGKKQSLSLLLRFIMIIDVGVSPPCLTTYIYVTDSDATKQ